MLQRSVQISSKLRNPKREAAVARCLVMDIQRKHWKHEAGRLWSLSPFDVRQAAALAAEIARHGGDERLRQAAAQALPSLRGACLKAADQLRQALKRAVA
jgi:hypothetical protein